MFVVDTHVFIYAVDTSSPGHRRCRRLVDEWRSGTLPWFTTWGILYEFLRVATHPRVFAQPLSSSQAWSFVTALCGSSLRLLLPTERHQEIATAVLHDAGAVQGNLFHDMETVVLMREHGIGTLYTRDRDFRRFRGLRLVDPLSA
jgi:toxin-antitoxin system PIN domain toxin